MGLFGEGMVPCPQFSRKLTQKRETDLSGRPEGWKKQEDVPGRIELREKSDRQRCPRWASMPSPGDDGKGTATWQMRTDTLIGA